MKKIFLGITIALSLFTIVQAQTSPEQFLGFPIGSDQKLVSWQQVTDYFHQLEQHSDRVLVEKPVIDGRRVDPVWKSVRFHIIAPVGALPSLFFFVTE